MAFSQPTKKRKKSAGPNSFSAAAMASKFCAPLAIKTMANKDKEVICLYINAWIEKQKLKKTLVDFGAVIELISRKNGS